MPRSVSPAVIPVIGLLVAPLGFATSNVSRFVPDSAWATSAGAAWALGAASAAATTTAAAATR